jgi:hypothetical protein
MISEAIAKIQTGEALTAREREDLLIALWRLSGATLAVERFRDDADFAFYARGPEMAGIVFPPVDAWIQVESRKQPESSRGNVTQIMTRWLPADGRAMLARIRAAIDGLADPVPLKSTAEVPLDEWWPELAARIGPEARPISVSHRASSGLPDMGRRAVLIEFDDAGRNGVFFVQWHDGALEVMPGSPLAMELLGASGHSST